MEIWKDIEGYEGLYQVSNLGNVKSLNRLIKHNRSGFLKLKSKIIKPCTTKTGYVVFHLYKNSKQTHKTAHRLVAECFLENIFSKEDINHIDGNKLNNNILNLEWNTRSENLKHAYNTGLKERGEKHYNSKLTEKNILIIRELKGFSHTKIAEQYNVSRKCISKIINKETWKHV